MPLHVGIGNATGRLRQTNRGPEWRCTAEELGKPPQVLRGSGEQDLVPRAAQATQSKPIEPEDALHMCKPHLDLLALPTRLLEGLRIGQRTDMITHILIEVGG